MNKLLFLEAIQQIKFHLCSLTLEIIMKQAITPIIVTYMLITAGFLTACAPAEDAQNTGSNYPFNIVATSTIPTDLEGTWYVEQYSEGICYGTRIQFKGDLYMYDVGIGCTPADFGDYISAKAGWIEFQGHTNTTQGLLATQFTLISSSNGDIIKSGEEAVFYNLFYIDTVNNVLYLGNDPIVHVGENNTSEINRPISLILSEPYYPINQSIF
jgi:hypothetical protein